MRLAIALVLAHVFGPGFATSLGAEEEKERVAEARARFRELLVQFEGERELRPEERLATIQEFGTAPCPEAATFLRRLFKSEKDVLRPGIAVALGRLGIAEAAQGLIGDVVPVLTQRKEYFALEESLKGPWDDRAEKWLARYALTSRTRKVGVVHGILLRAVAGLRSERKYDTLLKEVPYVQPADQAYVLERVFGLQLKKAAGVAISLLNSRDADVQAAALDVLVGVKPKKYRSRFIKGLKSPHPLVRGVAIDGLSAGDADDLVKRVSPFLNDVDQRVQIAAVRALLRRGGEEVIEPLTRALDTAKYRVLDDLADALARLSGKDMGLFSAQWESWWAVNRSRNLPLKAMTAEEFSRFKSQQARASQAGARTVVRYYHGVRVLSRKTSFLLDASESMLEPYRGPDEGGARTSVKGTQPAGAGKKAETRMSMARKELQQLLDSFESEQRLNVFRFETFHVNFAASVLRAAPDELVKLTPDAREKLAGFIQASNAGGTTNLSAVIREAFRCEEVDTLFLLSDGGPTGGITDYEELLNTVQRWNRRRRIRLNTFGFALAKEERRLLLDLADQNYGVFMGL